MYGETDNSGGAQTGQEGLSPHVRGNPKYATFSRNSRRSIPACTGKPPRGSDRPAASRVYPRMYGETNIAVGLAIGGMGLSPHVRGNHVVSQGQQSFDGSIPACTGKPGPAPTTARTSGVYPRMYGETAFATCAYLLQGGLSPHVRGNL